MKMSLSGYSEIHFLLTDGIMVDFRQAFPEDLLSSIKVQRILTSYQLQKILMDSDNSPYYISAASGVVEAWSPSIIEGIYDIMKIKTSYHGCLIYLNIVGAGGVFEKYLGNRVIARNGRSRNGGLYSWEEQSRQ